MELAHAIIYGIVEGVTEFLPISSTGHLMLTTKLIGLANSEFVKTFEIAIQLGAVLAIVVLFPRRLLIDRATVERIVCAFIPTAFLGLIFYKLIKIYLLGNIPLVLATLFFGGIVMILLERYWLKNEMPFEKKISDLSYADAALIGGLQAVAFIPGVSRAFTTIFSGMWMGLSRKEAVEFSFLLAVPTMGAATALDLYKNHGLVTADNATALLVGAITAFIVAIVAVKWLLAYVSTHDFTIFGYYRIAVAAVFAAVFFM